MSLVSANKTETNTYAVELAISAEDFRAAFARSLKADGPYLIEVAIDADEFVLPMLPPGGSIEDIIVSRERGE